MIMVRDHRSNEAAEPNVWTKHIPGHTEQTKSITQTKSWKPTKTQSNNKTHRNSNTTIQHWVVGVAVLIKEKANDIMTNRCDAGEQALHCHLLVTNGTKPRCHLAPPTFQMNRPISRLHFYSHAAPFMSEQSQSTSIGKRFALCGSRALERYPTNWQALLWNQAEWHLT